MVDEGEMGAVQEDAPSAVRVSLSESVGLMGLSNGVAFIAGLVRQKIFAVFLGPAGVGALSLAMAFFELLTTLVRMGVPTGLLREASRAIAAGEPARVARAYQDSMARQLKIAVIAILACSVLAVVIARRVFAGALPVWTAPLLALALPLLLSSQLRESLLSAYGRIPRLVGSKVVITLASLVATVILVATWGLNGAVVQIAAGAAVAGVVSVWALRPVFVARNHAPASVEPTQATEAAQRIFKVGGAEALFHIGVTLNLLIFRSLLVAGLGLDANGLYQVVLGLSRQYVPAILGGVFVALYPRLSAANDADEDFAEERGAALRYVFILGVPLALLLLATRDWLIAVVLTEAFASAEGLFRWTAPGDVLMLLGGVLQIALLAQGNARRFVIAGLLSEAVYLGLFAWMIGFGLEGAAAAYLVAALVGLVIFGRAQALGLAGLARDIGTLRLLGGTALVVGAAVAPAWVGGPRMLVILAAILWLGLHRSVLLSRLSGRGGTE